MATLIYLDTHVVAWLFAGRVDLVPEPGRQRLEENELLISPIVCLELEYLFEIQRTSQPADIVVAALRSALGLGICDLPFSQVVDEARVQRWTRDPFDRIIVAQARCGSCELMTKDETIHEHYPRAVWS